MGLDMYLTRKISIGAKYEHNKIEGTIYITKHKQEIPLDLKKIDYIEEEAGYWRKANCIHKWFVDNVQNGNDDCGTYDVSIEKLKELLHLCQEVKKKAIIKDGKVSNGKHLVDGKWQDILEDGRIIENSEEIANILPTQSGFFFGCTDYDEWYLQDIDYTIKVIKEQIKRENELEENGIFTYLQYHSSW